MARRSGLGKGLGALIPTDGVPQDAVGLQEIPISSIAANRFQPRSSFDDEALQSLSDSIREVGVLQPVLVRVVDDGYELIAGERRWRAAKRAGRSTIPAIVRETEDVSSLEQALVENLHREDLNPLEEAAAYQQLIEDFGLTQEAAARRVGKSRSSVANLLRLFQLPPSIQRLLAEGQITAGHAKALLASPDRPYQEALAKRVIAEDLSVRDVERLVAERAALEEGLGSGTDTDRPTPPSPTRRLRPPGLLELEELLSESLSTRVQVSMGAKRGRVVIEFGDLEDLERIYRVIAGPTER